MNCERARSLMHAYVDSELPADDIIEIDQHLSGCAFCSQAYANVRQLSSCMRKEEFYFKSPPGLKQSLRASLFTQKRSRPHWFSFLWFKLTLSTAGVALVALSIVWLGGRRPPIDLLAQELTSSHVRSLMASHLTDVTSTDQHTVKPWFAGKLDFAPRVVDLSDRGFPLIGGRLEYLQEHPAAALVYQHRKHYINVFIWPASQSPKGQGDRIVHNGFNLIHWLDSGMSYWAVSDLNATDLQSFSQLMRSKP